jgi:hypothetical protein
VILKDASSSSKPIEAARKELPYSFDVNSSKPWIKEPPGDQNQSQQANIGASSNIHRGAMHRSPSATPHHLPQLNWRRDHLRRVSNVKYDESMWREKSQTVSTHEDERSVTPRP